MRRACETAASAPGWRSSLCCRSRPRSTRRPPACWPALATPLRRRGRVLAFAVPVVSLLWTLLRLYRDPPVFAYDPFGGYFPGPIYDEALRPPLPLLLFRVANVGVGGDRHRPGAGGRRARARSAPLQPPGAGRRVPAAGRLARSLRGRRPPGLSRHARRPGAGAGPDADQRPLRRPLRARPPHARRSGAGARGPGVPLRPASPDAGGEAGRPDHRVGLPRRGHQEGAGRRRSHAVRAPVDARDLRAGRGFPVDAAAPRDGARVRGRVRRSVLRRVAGLALGAAAPPRLGGRDDRGAGRGGRRRRARRRRHHPPGGGGDAGGRVWRRRCRRWSGPASARSPGPARTRWLARSPPTCCRRAAPRSCARSTSRPGTSATSTACRWRTSSTSGAGSWRPSPSTSSSARTRPSSSGGPRSSRGSARASWPRGSPRRAASCWSSPRRRPSSSNRPARTTRPSRFTGWGSRAPSSRPARWVRRAPRWPTCPSTASLTEPLQAEVESLAAALDFATGDFAAAQQHQRRALQLASTDADRRLATAKLAGLADANARATLGRALFGDLPVDGRARSGADVLPADRVRAPLPGGSPGALSGRPPAAAARSGAGVAAAGPRLRRSDGRRPTRPRCRSSSRASAGA